MNSTVNQYTLEDHEELLRLKKAWSQMLLQITKEAPYNVVDRFLKPLKPVQLENSIATIEAPGTFVLEWVKEKFLPRLKGILSKILEDNVTIQLIVKNSEMLNQKKPQASLSFSTGPASMEVSQLYMPDRFQPNEKYRFDTFIIGQSNRLAYAGAKAIATEPGTKYNPLFIYGASGLGKTHLLHSIAQEVLSKNPRYPIVYISAQQFAEKFVHALQNNRIEQFRRAQRNVGVWLVDDIQFIAGKDKTQEEIFHTFNSMHSLGKQIVLCSDRPPRDLFLMDERLRSRFESGLVADILLPDTETRCAILLSKANQEKIYIEHEVAMYLAEGVPGNIRVLEGALIKLAAQASIENMPITRELARHIVDQYYRSDFFAKPNIDQILDMVSEHYHLSVEEIRGQSRKAPIAHARHVAIYLIREITHDSWKHIGSLFGNRDHTSIMHGHQKISLMIVKDIDLKKAIQSFIQHFTAENRT